MTPASAAAMRVQMNVLSAQAAGGGKPQSATDAQRMGFAEALKNSIDQINDLKASAKAQSRAFQAGAPGVELHEVMVDNQKAGLAFEMGVQVRNRLVSAYKDIMNMPV